MFLQLSEIDEIISLTPSRVGLRIKLGSQIPEVIELDPAKVHVLLIEDEIFIMHDDGEDDYLMHDDDEDDFIIT